MRKIKKPTAPRSIKVPKARPTDPETSWDAARSLTDEQLRRSQEQVLQTFRRIGSMTDEGLLMALETAEIKMSDSGARTRRKELVDKGYLRDSGQRAETESGRKTIIWELSDDDD